MKIDVWVSTGVTSIYLGNRVICEDNDQLKFSSLLKYGVLSANYWRWCMHFGNGIADVAYAFAA